MIRNLIAEKQAREAHWWASYNAVGLSEAHRANIARFKAEQAQAIERCNAEQREYEANVVAINRAARAWRLKDEALL